MVGPGNWFGVLLAGIFISRIQERTWKADSLEALSLYVVEH
jgi:hypothetical protein